MRGPFSFWAILGLALFFGGAAVGHGLGLGVGVFGGYAVPTGDMADFEGFNLSSSPALSARAYVEVREYLAFELGAGYHIDYPPQTRKYWYFPEFTEVCVNGVCVFPGALAEVIILLIRSWLATKSYSIPVLETGRTLRT